MRRSSLLIDVGGITYKHEGNLLDPLALLKTIKPYHWFRQIILKSQSFTWTFSRLYTMHLNYYALQNKYVS